MKVIELKKHLSIINLFSFRLSVVYHTVKVKEVQKCRVTRQGVPRAHPCESDMPVDKCLVT